MIVQVIGVVSMLLAIFLIWAGATTTDERGHLFLLAGVLMFFLALLIATGRFPLREGVFVPPFASPWSSS